jgi:hypothetical protein
VFYCIDDTTTADSRPSMLRSLTNALDWRVRHESPDTKANHYLKKFNLWPSELSLSPLYKKRHDVVEWIEIRISLF